MQQRMVGGRVGFLVAGLWKGVRGIIEKVTFRPAIFCMNVASHLCCYFGVFRFFGSPGRSRTSQMWQRRSWRPSGPRRRKLPNKAGDVHGARGRGAGNCDRVLWRVQGQGGLLTGGRDVRRANARERREWEQDRRQSCRERWECSADVIE